MYRGKPYVRKKLKGLKREKQQQQNKRQVKPRPLDKSA